MELKVELLVHVKVCAAEGKPMGWEPKSCVAGVSVGMPPSSVSSKRLNSRSFSCGVMGALTAHSLGKFSLPLLEPFSTWYSLKRTRPHWPETCPTGVSKTNCMVGLPVRLSVNQDWVGGWTALKSTGARPSAGLGVDDLPFQVAT